MTADWHLHTSSKSVWAGVIVIFDSFTLCWAELCLCPHWHFSLPHESGTPAAGLQFISYGVAVCLLRLLGGLARLFALTSGRCLGKLTINHKINYDDWYSSYVLGYLVVRWKENIDRMLVYSTHLPRCYVVTWPLERWWGWENLYMTSGQWVVLVDLLYSSSGSTGACWAVSHCFMESCSDLGWRLALEVSSSRPG